MPAGSPGSLEALARRSSSRSSSGTTGWRSDVVRGGDDGADRLGRAEDQQGQRRRVGRLERLPALLTRRRAAGAGVIGGEVPNAADYQIAPSCACCCLRQLRPLIEARGGAFATGRPAFAATYRRCCRPIGCVALRAVRHRAPRAVRAHPCDVGERPLAHLLPTRASGLALGALVPGTGAVQVRRIIGDRKREPPC